MMWILSVNFVFITWLLVGKTLVVGSGVVCLVSEDEKHTSPYSH